MTHYLIKFPPFPPSGKAAVYNRGWDMPWNFTSIPASDSGSGAVHMYICYISPMRDGITYCAVIDGYLRLEDPTVAMISPFPHNLPPGVHFLGHDAAAKNQGFPPDQLRCP